MSGLKKLGMIRFAIHSAAMVFFAVLWVCGMVGLAYASVDESGISKDNQEPSLQTAVSLLKPRVQLQYLLDKTLQIAIDDLHNSGEVFPYGVVLNERGSLRLIQWPESQAKPTEDNMIRALRKQLMKAGRNPEALATAYFRGFRASRVSDQTEQTGIRVELDHREYSVIVFVPYVIDDDNGVTLLEPQFQPGQGRTFDNN